MSPAERGLFSYVYAEELAKGRFPHWALKQPARSAAPPTPAAEMFAETVDLASIEVKTRTQ
jgi:hypothetical protein